LTLRPGRLYLVPGFAHTVSRCATFLDHAWVNFTGHPGVLGTAFENGFAWKEVALGRKAPTDAFHAFSKFKKGATGENEAPCALGLAASAALLELLALLYAGHPPTHTLPRSRFRPLLEWVEAQLGEPLEIPAWAERAGLDPVYYANAFSAEIGAPPHQWLLRRRLERAQEMLWEDDQTVRAIARAVGFQDESYFSRLFRRKVGMTPRAYRQRRVQQN
jgi:AraC-like DNA-binding protein